MMPRRFRTLPVALLAPVALALVGFTAPSRNHPKPPTPTPAYNPPPSEPSPFSTADAFCVPAKNLFPNTPTTDPQLRAQPAEVVWLSPPSSDVSAANDDSDVDTFVRLVGRCGGIAGRPLSLHVVRSTGDAATDCVNAVDRFHPVIVVSSELPAAWSCIVKDRQTILLTGADVSNADLTGSGGRLVAAGSSEGIEQARLLALVESGRLDGRKVAIVAPPDADGAAFLQDATSALATKRIQPVALAAADTVLLPSLDLAALPQLQAATTPTRSQPLDVYSFDAVDPSVPATLAARVPNAPDPLRAVRLFGFAPVNDLAYRAGANPDTFSEMCNQAAAGRITRPGDTTTTTTEPKPPLAPSYLATADVCLLSRVVARGLYAAGPTLDQRALVTALHRLPFVDQTSPGGTRKPRPNQVVNEPVRRIEQTIALEQVGSTCPSASTGTTTTTTAAAPPILCWSPATDWDSGGRVVNVPLPVAATPAAH
jgi:hypothetical protein